MVYWWSTGILGRTDTQEAEMALPKTTAPGPAIPERTSHTHSNCREGRWENIRSLISENVPFTRLLKAREEQYGDYVAFRKYQAGWANGLVQTPPLRSEASSRTSWGKKQDESSHFPMNRINKKTALNNGNLYHQSSSFHRHYLSRFKSIPCFLFLTTGGLS